ncbi:MAG: c-type cytochrome [Parafilimonas sp.]
MIKTKAFILISTLFVILFCVAAKKKFTQQQNHAPVVKILSPLNNSSYNAGTQVHYKISVSDKEDGESNYDEIDAKQVLLEIKYFSDSSKLTIANSKNEQDAPGLAAIKMSNCFNCHGFDTKITGPSFNEIIKRYKPTAANMALLQKRIKSGSTGIWSKTPMPTHPELSDTQIKNMVQWIMQNASAPNVHYYIGLEGNFNLELPSTANKSGAYLATASYTDHGINNKGERLEGKDAIIIKLNNALY